ncbi:MAG TPA: hypothetical protein VK956_21100, partial [Verrucomicrobium sp.]|nr:hypothetical protein [Verrucomicrobium sp.]
MTTLLQRLSAYLIRLSSSRWFHVLMFVLLLVRLTWGMWEWRDLTYGDTSSYFASFSRERDDGKSYSLVFSPLYVWYYSFFGSAFSDASAATVLHRIGVIFMAGFSVFLLFRSVLPKAVGWLVAAWWIVLPINWNALYEVHLFGVVPLALGCWAVSVARRRTLWLGIGLAFVWMGALLVRNEFALSVALLTLCCVLREWWVARRAASGLKWAALGRSILLLAAPGLLVTLLSVMVFHEHWQSWKGVRKQFKGRHELNIAQVYPFTYQQRHPEWTQSPWTEGHKLMEEHFGMQFP